jgi:hypothetical protein
MRELTVLSQSLERSRRPESRRVGNAHDGNQNHRVEDRGQGFDTCQLNGDHKGRVATFTSSPIIERAVRGYNKTNEE